MDHIVSDSKISVWRFTIKESQCQYVWSIMMVKSYKTLTSPPAGCTLAKSVWKSDTKQTKLLSGGCKTMKLFLSMIICINFIFYNKLFKLNKKSITVFVDIVYEVIDKIFWLNCFLNSKIPSQSFRLTNSSILNNLQLTFSKVSKFS